MPERVTVEVGGFSSGVYYWSRLIKYDEDEADVETEAWEFFEKHHGERGNYGNAAANVEPRDVPRLERVLVEIGGYTTKAGIKKRGHMAHRWKRVVYKKELSHGSHKYEKPEESKEDDAGKS